MHVAGLPRRHHRHDGRQYDGHDHDGRIDRWLEQRQSRVVEHLKQGGVIRSREYCELVSVPERTGLRDLNDLVRRGVLERLGSRRGAVYRLAERGIRPR